MNILLWCWNKGHIINISLSYFFFFKKNVSKHIYWGCLWYFSHMPTKRVFMEKTCSMRSVAPLCIFLFVFSFVLFCFRWLLHWMLTSNSLSLIQLFIFILHLKYFCASFTHLFIYSTQMWRAMTTIFMNSIYAGMYK